jgi:hypothetical protein
MTAPDIITPYAALTSTPPLSDPAAPIPPSRPTALPTPRPGRGRALRGFLRP